MPEHFKIDFYDREKRFKAAVARIDSWCKTNHNKLLIYKLLTWAQATDISYARRLKYLMFLKHTISWLDKDLDTLNKDDILYVAAKINETTFTPQALTSISLKLLWIN